FLPDEAMTPVAALSFCAKQAALEDEDRDCYHAFAVYHVGDARVIGDVGFYCPSGPENQADLGFQFHPDYHGQGLATEAVLALLHHGFENWNLRRVTSGCDARNLPSFRLMERVGMRREAHFVSSRVTKGVLHDEYAYALLRDEWFAQK
ncbi:N-acetyltransferase, partial [bacterium]